MDLWKNKIVHAYFLTLSILFFPATVNADVCGPYCPSDAYCSSEQLCDPCRGWCCFGGIEVGVDFLWWKPCIDELDYAAISTYSEDKTYVSYKSICLDWEPGARVYVGLPNFYCDIGLYASYTYICSNDSSSIEEEGRIISPLAHPDSQSGTLFDEAIASWDLYYHEWEVLFGYNICCSPCHILMPFIGVAGIIVDQELDVKLFLDSKECPVMWDSCYWGIGLRAGTEYTYRFNDCFRFFANANGTLLAGKADSKNEQEEFSDDLCINDDDNCCLFVSGFHIGTGFIFDTCLCNMDLSLRVGYEFLHWENLPNHRVFSGTDEEIAELSHSTSPNVRNLGFHGLFAGVSLSF